MNAYRPLKPEQATSSNDKQSLDDESMPPSSGHEFDQTLGMGSTEALSHTTISRGSQRRAGNNISLDGNELSLGGMKTRSVADLRAARESRANEALRMKDEQLRILQDQNNQLLANLDRVEEEATRIQQERLAAEEENRTLRETVFESQGRARVAEAALNKVQAETADRDKQLRIMTDQNAELLRLLEQEEAQTAKLSTSSEAAVKDLETLRSKYGSLLTTAKSHEEMASRAAREGQLRAEEVRLLRAESEQVKQQNSELKMKTQVELESLQEQLRVRKEKQYQLLEKLQSQEEAKRQAEDQVSGMEDKLRALHAKSLELETQLQVEARARRSAEEANRNLVTGAENARQNIRELQGKVERSESERMRMEMESRDSGEQLREMAEKVFQLLERLKLAELAKNKAMEALRHKDQELMAMKQKNSRLIKESTKEGKSRVKAELDLRVCQDQVSALKKHNAQLACRCREEAKAKLKEHDERVETQDKVRTLGGRLSFLLNKMQSDEEARVILKEEAKKTEAQVKSLTARAEELQRKLEEAGESNRIITQAVRLKQDEVDQLTVINSAVNRQLKAKDPATSGNEDSRPELDSAGTDADEASGERVGHNGGGGDPRDTEAVRTSGGRGVFYVESRPTQGLLMAKAKRAADREWLEGHEVNAFLKRAQKTPRFKELAVERICQAYALLLVEEEDRKSREAELVGRAERLELMCRKNAYLQDKVVVEEEAKRRTLLRYVHAVKAAASLGLDDGSHKSIVTAVGRPGRGIIQLPESGITDEEVHALAALLRGNTTIAELNLRGNQVTDEGAAALGAVLAGRMGLRSVDLRGNRVSKQGIRTIAEALDRSERVRHVYVHAGGKVEALGTSVWAAPRGAASAAENRGAGDSSLDHGAQQSASASSPSQGTVPLVTVETVCVVDLRENMPSEAVGGRGAVGAAALATAMEDPSAPLPSGITPQLVSGAGTGRTPVFAMSVLPGELGSGVKGNDSAGARVRDDGQPKEEKPSQRIKREATARRRAERRARDRESRRNKKMELGWTGRNGGFDARPSSKGSIGGTTCGTRAGGGGLPRVGVGASTLAGRGSRYPHLGTDHCRGEANGGAGNIEGEKDRRGGAEDSICLLRSSSAPDIPPPSASPTHIADDQQENRRRDGSRGGGGAREEQAHALSLAKEISRRG